MYRPEKFPEIEIFGSYSPAEYERGYQAEPAEVEFDHLEINGGPVSDRLQDHLFETFGDDWEAEIIAKAKRRVA